MLNKLSFYLLITFFQSILCIAQPTVKQYTWWDPAKNEVPVIEGQAWPAEMKGGYERLPARAEKLVRKEVWALAHNTAGLVISFRTNSPEIVVRYKVGGTLALPHMPATGVSGLDLYGIGKNGNWLWCKGEFSFKDTITYTFKNIDANDTSYPFHQKGGEYRLYLPLYNNVSWLEIGVVPGSSLSPLQSRKDKPIVVYGTSIAQGGCASRPGNAWTAILGRKMERPLINLGFSGNGRLEKELIEMIAEIDAKVYVLDCLPNLTGNNLAPEEITKRILESVRSIRNAGKLTPILLTEHGGYTDDLINPQSRKRVEDINKLMKSAFHQLEQEGVKNIFLLAKEEINLDYNSMVDGVHPSDGGMFQYAAAYERKLRQVMNEPVGNLSTTQPCTQNRDANTYDWISRHNEILALQDKTPSIVFLGNSITNFWGGKPVAPISRGKESWDKFIEPYHVINAGFGWDRIENVLWRVHHDELDGLNARQVVLLIGTNNLDFNSDIEIIQGLRQLIAAIKIRQPGAKILVLGLIPREAKESRIVLLNKSIAKLAGSLHSTYAEIGEKLLTPKGNIDKALFEEDGVHPNASGYQRMGEALMPFLVR